MRTSRKLDNKGFTLVEIMVAMFILTIGIMGVTGMFITTIKANAFARNTTVANRLAQNLIEQVKTQTFSNAIADMCTDTGISNCSATSSLSAASCGGTRLTRSRTGDFKQSPLTDLNAITYTVRLDGVEDSPICGLSTITVTVGWSDSYGAHTTKAITYMEK